MPNRGEEVGGGAAQAEIKSKHKETFVTFLVIFMTVLICTSKMYVCAVITRELTRARNGAWRGRARGRGQA